MRPPRLAGPCHPPLAVPLTPRPPPRPPSPTFAGEGIMLHGIWLGVCGTTRRFPLPKTSHRNPRRHGLPPSKRPQSTAAAQTEPLPPPAPPMASPPPRHHLHFGLRATPKRLLEDPRSLARSLELSPRPQTGQPCCGLLSTAQPPDVLAHSLSRSQAFEGSANIILRRLGTPSQGTSSLPPKWPNSPPPGAPDMRTTKT